MKVIIALEHDFGHPGNKPSKEFVFKVFAEKLPKKLKTDFEEWELTSLHIED